ncbi:MAG: multidrug ABC transporter permease [Candidatus Angelobacter sp. Gp1-AA117]|nr:MAG: multidrug ABC transporter permease [Candidatus Angelobacter sp. Gp1-AA117]
MAKAIGKALESGAPRAAWDNQSAPAAFLRATLALADVEVRKLRRDPTELLTRAIQPALWLLIFGQVFAHLKSIPTGSLDYLSFMVPGILAQSVLFIAIFYGINVAGVIGFIILGSAVFSTFSLAVACIVKTRERFMGIGQVLTMPLFFASNAIYPIAGMPGWMRVVANVNPLSYQVDALRSLMVRGGQPVFGVGFDAIVLLLILTGLVLLTARLYPNVVQ